MKKTYHIIVIGCQMNKSDSERIAGYLEDRGYKEAHKNQASLVLIATCGVRQTAEDRIYGIIQNLEKNNPKAKIIITGCLSERDDVRKRVGDRVNLFLPIRELPQFENYLFSLEAHKKNLWVNAERSPKEEKYLYQKPKYNSKFSAFVPIGNGCNNFCTYCVVPYARHREVYRPFDEIVSEVRSLIQKGYKEVILIAQNVNSFKDKDKDFADLLTELNNIAGDFWIRFATSHPKDMSDKLINAVINLDKVCRHIHLPAQAGDNEVLRQMNRNYTKEHYLGLIDKIKSTDKEYLNMNKEWQLPVSLTTDIIVGFPGETRKQFSETLDLFNRVKYDMAYVAEYSPRPGTAAEKMDDNVFPDEKKAREEELMDVLRVTGLENNKAYLDQKVKVLIEGVNRKGVLFGKTETFKSTKIETTANPEESLSDNGAGRKQKKELIGQFVKVKIINVEDFGLEGEIV